MYCGFSATISTGLNELGYQKESQLFNPEKKQIWVTYNHAKSIEQRRAMMQNELIALMCGRLVIFPLWNKSFERISIRVNLMIKSHS